MPKKTKKQIACEQMMEEIIDEAEFLLEDRNMPKNLNTVLNKIEDRLSKNLCSLEVSTILYELEESTDTLSAPEYRSVVWPLITKLETLKEKMK